MRKKTHNEYILEVAAINTNIKVIGQYDGNHTPIIHKCCIDDYEWMASPANILKGQGCPRCKSLKLHSLKVKSHEQYVDEVNQIHNHNIVVIGEYVGNRTCILHKCVIDGYVWSATPGNILKGSGCPMCASEKQKLRQMKSHDDYVAQVAVINPNIDVIDQYIGAEIKILHKCKIDGHEWHVLPSNILSGHGCPVCNASRGEREIINYLIKHNIIYIPQYTFDKCKNKKMLPFDFYLPDYNICIEYDGEQHYRPVDYFGGECGFKQRQYNDSIKTTYCQLHGIQLLRIKYDQDVGIELNKFFNNTKLTKEVI